MKTEYEKAKEIIKYDTEYPAHKITWAYEVIDKWEFANLKVIEELESLIDNLDSPWNRDVLRRRIEELKEK